MDAHEKTTAQEALADLIKAILRMSAHAHRVGSSRIEDLGLTNARWLMLEEISAALLPLTVSETARRLGLSRQAVQRLADEMAAEGLLRFVENPPDRRAKVVVLTEPGQEVRLKASDRVLELNTAVAEGLSPQELRAAATLIETVTERMRERA